MFCHQCGAKLENGMRFCPSCGAKIFVEGLSTDQNIAELDKPRVCFKTSILPNHSPQKGKYQEENRKISPVFQAFQAQ